MNWRELEGAPGEGCSARARRAPDLDQQYTSVRIGDARAARVRGARQAVRRARRNESAGRCATHASGSCARQASSTASDTWSANLSCKTQRGAGQRQVEEGTTKGADKAPPHACRTCQQIGTHRVALVHRLAREKEVLRHSNQTVFFAEPLFGVQVRGRVEGTGNGNAWGDPRRDQALTHTG
jgi:hypothetical protein